MLGLTEPVGRVGACAALVAVLALTCGGQVRERAETGVLGVAVELARRDHADLDAEAVAARIDALAAEYRALVPPDSSPKQRADAFATLLFEVGGFSSVDELDSSRTLHVDSVLERRTGYCLSLSVVALAVAEQVGEPLYGVALPNHFFVRWDDGTFRRNLELTRGGEEIDDATLTARMGDFLRDDSIYLRNLELEQIRGILLHNRGFVAMHEGRTGDAWADLRAARKLVPDLPEVHRNLGVLAGERRDWPASIAAFERALELYPGDIDALLNLALARHAAGDAGAALEDVAMVLLLAPGHPRATELTAAWALHGPNALKGMARPDGAAPGLRGRYYRGTRFQQLVAVRIDRDLDFDWQRNRPFPGMPRDEFSVRWDGWLRADDPGLYTFFVVVNDGVRIRVDGELVVDQWRDAGYTSWTGTGEVELAAGWHPIEIDYYDRSDNARLVCLVSRSGDTYPLELEQHLFHRAE